MPDIQDYTLAQVRLFTAAIVVQRRETQRDRALAARAGAASSSAFKKYLRSVDAHQ